jgi:hypothetical protein
MLQQKLLLYCLHFGKPRGTGKVQFLTRGSGDVNSTPPQILGTIHVPVIALSHQKIVDQLFKINLTKDSCGSFSTSPEIQLKLHYTKTPSVSFVSIFVLYSGKLNPCRKKYQYKISNPKKWWAEGHLQKF